MKDKLDNKDGLIERKLQCKLFTVEVDKSGLFHFEKNEKSAECSLLQLLINTSYINEDNSKELIAKLCAIGYLNSPGNNRNGCIVILKNGIKDKNCFCKTLFANIFTPHNSKFLHYKKNIVKNITPDDHSCFIIDDVSSDVDYYSLCIYVSTNWHGLVSAEKTPKILITTNREDFTNRGLSFDKRVWILNFSDFYNEHNKPVFDNTLRDELINDCVDCYKHFGKIQS